MFDILKRDSKHGVEVSPSIIFYSVGILGGLYFFYQVRNVLILLFLALILMVALHPAVNKFQKKFKLPRGLSIALAYLLFVIILILAVASVLPPLVSELLNLFRVIEIPSFQNQINNIELNLSDLGGLIEQLGGSVNFIISAITSTFAGVFTLITMMVMSVYMMIDRPHFHKKIAWFTNKPKHFKAAKKFIDSLEEQLGGWVRGQIILMLSIALASYLGLSLLKIPFALPLAVLAGLLEVLPNLGPFISAVPAVIIALITFGPNMGGIVILLYIVIQNLENNILVPRIMAANANVNPLIAIVSVIAGFEIAGFVGAMLAIPLYIVARAFYSAFKNRQISS